MSDAAPNAVPEQSSFAEDLFDIWFTPAAVFARRAKSGFFLIMSLVTLALGGLFLANRGAMQSIMEGESRRQIAAVMKANPSITQEQMSAGGGASGTWAAVAIFVFTPIGLFLIGVGAWLVAKILGAQDLGLGTAVMIAGWSYLPRILEGIGVTIQGTLLDTSAMTGRFQLSLGVGRFLDPAMNAAALSFLGRIDVFTLWTSVLLGIGICVIGKVPREKVIPAAGMMWLFGAIPVLFQLGFAALMGG